MSKTMTKADLVARIREYDASNLPTTEVVRVVESVFRRMEEALCNGETIRLQDFGTFEIKERAPRTARNPKTGETIQVPARLAATWRPAKRIKDKLNS